MIIQESIADFKTHGLKGATAAILTGDQIKQMHNSRDFRSINISDNQRSQLIKSIVARNMQNFQFQKSLMANKQGSKERLDPKTADDQDEILMESKMFGQPGSLQGLNPYN